MDQLVLSKMVSAQQVALKWVQRYGNINIEEFGTVRLCVRTSQHIPANFPNFKLSKAMRFSFKPIDDLSRFTFFTLLPGYWLTLEYISGSEKCLCSVCEKIFYTECEEKVVPCILFRRVRPFRQWCSDPFLNGTNSIAKYQWPIHSRNH